MVSMCGVHSPAQGARAHACLPPSVARPEFVSCTAAAGECTGVTPRAVSVQVPVLYAARSSGSLKAQPSLLNNQSALFNSPSNKGKLLFPSRPKESEAAAPVAPAPAPAAPRAHPPAPPPQPPLTAPSTSVPDAVPLRRLASSSSAQQSGAVDLVTQRWPSKCRSGLAADAEPLRRQVSSDPGMSPTRRGAEAYLALVVQVAVVADGGVSATWCRSLRVASSVLARAVFRKALELYECGTRPHHLQPLLRLQHKKRHASARSPG